jgi:N-acetylmuramidase
MTPLVQRDDFRRVWFAIEAPAPTNDVQALAGAQLDDLFALYVTTNVVHQLPPNRETFGHSWIYSSAGSGHIRAAIRTKLSAELVGGAGRRKSLLDSIALLHGAPERKTDLQLMVNDVFESSGWRAEAQIPINPAWSPLKRRCAKLWNAKGSLFANLAAGIDPGIEPYVIGGIMAAETGQKFYVAGRAVARFEAHVFWKRWGKTSPARAQLFNQHFKKTKPHKWRREPDGVFQKYHINQRKEWEVLDFARTLDGEANVKAVESTSFGAGQTMGFNAQRVGFGSALEMLQHYQTQERAQIEGVAEYINTITPPAKRTAVIDAIKQENFLPLSQAYGPQDPEGHSKRIAAAVKAMKELVAEPAAAP